MLTLGTQRDLTNDMLIKGIIDSVVTVNQFYAMLPFKGIQGNALAYNREEVGEDQANLVGVLNTANTAQTTAGGAFTGINKTVQTFSRHSTELTTIIGDAQVNGLIQAVGSDYNDATAVQVAAKAKGIGRVYMDRLINGQNSAGSTFTTSSTINLTGDNNGVERVNALLDRSFLTATPATTVAVNAAAFTAANTFVIRGVSFVGNFGTVSTNVLTLNAAGVALFNFISRIENIRNSTGRQTSTDGSSSFDGLENFVLASGNLIDASVAGTNETLVAAGNRRLAYLDEIIDRVHDKDGMVDYLMMNSAGVRNITAAFRGVGTGFDMMDVKTSSGGVMSVQSYRGVPIFRNDFIGTGTRAGLTGGDGNNSALIYAGTIDDGSFTHGICGLTALKSAGMQVQKLGAREEADADITRVKWYCGLAHFSELGLVRGNMA